VKLNIELLARAAGVGRLDPICVERLSTFAERLCEANRKINLISRSVDPVAEIETQIAISLLPIRLISSGIETWIDIGSGGGFPVVPLACALGEIQFTAVEQIFKKAYFIERTSQELGLNNLRVEARSIEAVISDDNPARYSAASIKAVTETDQSLRWANNLLLDDGLMITYKPRMRGDDDHAMAKKHGFELTNHISVKELIDIIDVDVVMYQKSRQ